MPEIKHKRPCGKCPWRRASAPGWLGASSSPQRDFVDNALADYSVEPLPCHSAINYEDPSWREVQYPDAPLCAGALIFARNTGKLPRDEEKAARIMSVEEDHEMVFSSAQEFVAHHSGLGNTTPGDVVDDTLRYKCRSCGAHVLRAAELSEGHCPTCDSKITDFYDGYTEPPGMRCVEECGISELDSSECLDGTCPGCGGPVD